MSADPSKQLPTPPRLAVEELHAFSAADLSDLCDATDAAIKAGGGFGWVELPSRDVLERFWQGVAAMPLRLLFLARLDGVVCDADAQAWHTFLNQNHISWTAWKFDGCEDASCLLKEGAPVNGGFGDEWLQGHGPFVRARLLE